MPGQQILSLASLIVFTFGALSFSVLTLVYWRERGARPEREGSAFPLFTVACAVSFLVSLFSQVAAAWNAGPAWMTGSTIALDLATGFIPPLLFHTVMEQEAGRMRAPGFWRRLLPAAYTLAALLAVAKCLDDADLLSDRWADRVEAASAMLLAAAAGLGLAIQWSSRLPLQTAARRYRLWVAVLLWLILLSAAATLPMPEALLNAAPDYLLLAFFCVTLYYKERLIFFDLLIKKGAHFAAGLVALTLLFALGGKPLLDRPWICALALTPFWMAGPWVYGRLAGFIDRVWLRRRYSAADAERRFVDSIQPAATETELRELAERSLSEIFQTRAEIRLGTALADAGREGLSAELADRQGAPAGAVLLAARASAIPFLSDDRKLLQSLTRTLGVVLENVRFLHERRRQEEQARELRWLASRAELKALRAQINPHFLFNALNAIAGLIQDRPQLADETIEQLAHVFRYTLRKSETEWVRLDEEVEFVTAYLRVEQARFGERLAVRLEIDPATAAIPIPAMSVQPLVENAIKHGVSTVEGPGAVSLRTALQGELLTVEVSDTGPGFPPGFCCEAAADSGHGLRNVVARLRGYYGDSAALRWENGQRRTCVVLTIPLLPAAEFLRSDANVARVDRGR